MFDLLIQNGTILNGTGAPSFYGDIGIKDGKIARIGKGLEGAKTTIDASGLTVTPGFIDSHSHSDNALLEFPELLEKIEQGITTSIAGQCGSSPAPISRDVTPETAVQVAEFGSELDVYRTFETFADIAKNVPTGSNTAVLVGHCALRKAVMGMENREPTAEELERMKALLRNGMDHGALGVLTVLAFGMFRHEKWEKPLQLVTMMFLHGVLAEGRMFLLGPISVPEQALAVFALIPIWLYNGEKGPRNRFLQYGSYVFYPAHMVILHLIRTIW